MKTTNQYQNRINRVGRISFGLAFIWFFLIPTIICAKYNIFPSLKQYLNASLSLFLILTPIALSEIISFVPLLGSGASYLAFETGNVSNLKLPCAMNALKIAGIEPGTEEAEVLSTISVAISSIITTIIMILAVILLVPLSSFFTNQYVLIATNNVIPALFGALALSFFGDSESPVKGQWKASVIPFILVIIIHYFVYPISGFEGIVILIMIPVTILCARVLHKKGQITVVKANNPVNAVKESEMTLKE
jgi:hypothetical protein